MEGFRSLGQNEPVEFEAKLTDKGYEATKVYGPSQSQCKGSEFRPRAKRKYRKMRWVFKSSWKRPLYLLFCLVDATTVESLQTILLKCAP